MEEMSSSRRTKVSLESSPQQPASNHNTDTEVTRTWKRLAKSKAALRHIQSHKEATPGTGFCLDSINTSSKKKSSKTVSGRDGRQVAAQAGVSKTRCRSQQSPDKSSSRSPLRNTTQDSNVRRKNCVEFREPLASYREATPPSHPGSQLEADSLKSVPGSSYPSFPLSSHPSQLVHQRDTSDKQTGRDLESTHSLALGSTEVCYLNDQQALNTLRTEENTLRAQRTMESQELNPCAIRTPASTRHGESTLSNSPGSASLRLENLRRQQPDDRLEKLKECIRRQRQHMEETAEKEKLLGYLEQPISSNAGTTGVPSVKMRKVSTAPPGSIYKGFNSTDLNDQAPDLKVWKDDDFQTLPREIYRGLSQHFAETTRIKHQQQKEQRANTPKEKIHLNIVRKVHRAAPASDLNSKPIINPASWREGHKRVKMVLESGSKQPREKDTHCPAERSSQTASHHHSGSRSQLNRQPRPNSRERPQSKFSRQQKKHQTTSPVDLSAKLDRARVEVSTDLLSADIKGILDDLQLECKELEAERARKRSRGGCSDRRGREGSGSQTRTAVSLWGCAGAATESSRGGCSGSPTASRSKTSSTADSGHKKRHYDADTVRQYIARQQEERKRRQADEKRVMREDAEKRNQRLQELYRKQREVAKSETPVALVQKQLQETYSKLLIEEAQLDEETARTYNAASSSYMRPMYQPSGESDKENKRLEAPQSPSSSDRSLSDQPPPTLSRNPLDDGVASLLQPDRLCPTVGPVTGSSGSRSATDDHLLSQLLRLDKANSNIKHTERPATASVDRTQSNMSRIEAIKATATSLSNRIESEALKLAGNGITYGTPTSVTVDNIHIPRASDFNDGCWAGRTPRAAENTDMASKSQRILTSTGHSSYDDMAVPGAGNLHALREEIEKNASCVSPTSPYASHVNRLGPALNSNSEEKRNLVNGLGNVERTGKVTQNKERNKEVLQDSSASSISEGPLLSELSFSEEEASCPCPFGGGSLRTPQDLEAAGYHTSQRKDHQPLREFESDAVSCLPFTKHNSGKTGWEELNKGSPLSVINIFTKNLYGHVEVSERNLERNSSSTHSAQSEHARGTSALYEDDFVSSHSSRNSSQLKRGCKSPSVNSHFEELMRRSPYEKSTGGIYSQHSSVHTSAPLPHYSPGSTSGSSPLSRHSSRRKGTASDLSDGTLVEEHVSSPHLKSSDSRKKRSSKTYANSQARSLHTNDTLEQHQQGPRFTFPPDDPQTGSPPAANSQSERVRGGTKAVTTSTPDTSAHGFITRTRSPGKLHYSPAVLQQRMAAELQYMDSIDGSVKQLGDMERLVGVSMAQQESASLVQILKAKQQRHENDLYELKIKAEREALEAKLQMEESRQKVARAHLELQEGLAAAQRETLEGLQESTTKMMSQQAEAACYTVDAARHIKELAEMTRSQIPAVVLGPSILDQQESSHLNQQQDKVDSDSYQSEVSGRGVKSEDPPSLLNSLSPSDSLSFKRPNLSGGTPSSHHSQSHVSSDYSEQVKQEATNRKLKSCDGEARQEKEVAGSSIEEELATVADDSLCSESIHSALDGKGNSTPVASDYSLKFDESMTEDEIEERSFRSLLPSEAHRRGTMEKKSHDHEDTIMGFSGGQGSFSQFTMDMVRQYMKDEEVRLQHQSSLLRLRHKALKEKTRTELAWLEHQKKRLRDKGEDDKMPPIRKKQRGLLLKLQQEQAEIKRLQEANKAARKERQLLMKQQEEIEHMRNSTLRLKERLKCAGGEVSETPVSEVAGSEAACSSIRHSEDIRSLSPSLSVSGSETSSIIQKLKKMHSHMDEKFLTKREQQLVQRRHRAEELLQWKQRLDQEEAEVRRMEKEALIVWEQRTPQDKDHEMSETQKNETLDVSSQPSQGLSTEPRTDSEKEYTTEGECSSVTESSMHREGLTTPPTSVPKTPLASNQNSHPSYTQDFTSASQSPSKQLSLQSNHRPAASPSDGNNKNKMQLSSTSQTPNETCNQSTDPAKSKQPVTTSNQSDIESRIKALREEVRKRKFMAYHLKKEQKKRTKERLKAEEASLLKQLQNYNNFIVKTEAELYKEPEAAREDNSQVESTSSQEPSINQRSPHRSETTKIKDSERAQTGASYHQDAPFQQHFSISTSACEELSNEEPQTSTMAAFDRKDCPTAAQGRLQPPESLSKASSKDHKVMSVNDDISDHRSDLLEELALQRSSKVDDDLSEPLLKLEKDLSLISSVIDDEDVEHASYVSSERDTEVKQKDTLEGEETPKSKKIASYQPYSAGVDPTASSHRSRSPPFSDNAHSPYSTALPLNEEATPKDFEALPLVDSYRDDFESSVGSSHKEYQSQRSSPPPEVKYPPSRGTTFDSQDEVVEEDIAEELGNRSGASEQSRKSEGLLELDERPKDFEQDHGHVNRSHSPPVSPLQTPITQDLDEMPGFSLGDRVLVGGVQPGTLRFKGPTSFANGFWAGVELDKSEGSNNGTYDGIVYFQCEESHGIFAPPDKITHLPDKFEFYTDTTEDEDSFCDDLSGKGGKRPTSSDTTQEQSNHKIEDEKTFLMDTKHGDKNIMDRSQKDQSQLKNTSINSQHHKKSNNSECHGDARDIMLDFKDTSHYIFISGLESKEVTTLTERDDFTPVEPTSNIRDGIIRKEKDLVLADTFADQLVNTFLKDTLRQFAEIKKAKEQKIRSLNQEKGDFFTEPADGEEWITPVDQKDGLPFFLPVDKEELSSPELCNRPESPVLGAIGQEELAKRLAELELSRELLDGLGDDQDWFDEDFGLSSRREQQRLKQEEEEARLGRGLGISGSSAVAAMGGVVTSSNLEHQVKTPPRPELPLPLPPKLPEQPAMVVPHSAAEVEKMVHAATQEIWERCDLGNEGIIELVQLPNIQASQQYLGEEPDSQDPEAVSIYSYRKAVYDLTWEILHDVYSEDPNTDQPPWVKLRHAKSSSFHRVKMPGDLSKVQEFITGEVLKLYHLAKDQSQKTDWQKMLKFGRKKRDRVDHILVQELHEEEAQWVNYDEDELFVKMQLADSIFDALLKDTADVFTLISDKRVKRENLS